MMPSDRGIGSRLGVSAHVFEKKIGECTWSMSQFTEASARYAGTEFVQQYHYSDFENDNEIVIYFQKKFIFQIFYYF